MASNTRWSEDSGAATGSPAKGTTRTVGVTNCNWGATGGPIADPSATPIAAGLNGFTKWQFVEFQAAGTFTLIQNGKFGHSAGALPANVTLFTRVTSTYVAPSATTDGAMTDQTTVDATLAAGAAVSFQITGPEAAGSAASIGSGTLPVFTQFMVSQIRVGGAASPGLFANDVTLKFQWDES